ncbi:uncharacterized protein VTP21DRAFT_8159 [Calcarisporiella thermophila]|uniref:uncharacterized protein n=1 Tax=Calcarisporiella thermophila TaxID=911321 RepID=UPI0037443B94
MARPVFDTTKEILKSCSYNQRTRPIVALETTRENNFRFEISGISYAHSHPRGGWMWTLAVGVTLMLLFAVHPVAASSNWPRWGVVIGGRGAEETSYGVIHYRKGIKFLSCWTKYLAAKWCFCNDGETKLSASRSTVARWLFVLILIVIPGQVKAEPTLALPAGLVAGYCLGAVQYLISSAAAWSGAVALATWASGETALGKAVTAIGNPFCQWQEVFERLSAWWAGRPEGLQDWKWRAIMSGAIVVALPDDYTQRAYGTGTGVPLRRVYKIQRAPDNYVGAAGFKWAMVAKPTYLCRAKLIWPDPEVVTAVLAKDGDSVSVFLASLQVMLLLAAAVSTSITSTAISLVQYGALLLLPNALVRLLLVSTAPSASKMIVVRLEEDPPFGQWGRARWHSTLPYGLAQMGIAAAVLWSYFIMGRSLASILRLCTGLLFGIPLILSYIVYAIWPSSAAGGFVMFLPGTAGLLAWGTAIAHDIAQCWARPALVRDVLQPTSLKLISTYGSST